MIATYLTHLVIMILIYIILVASINLSIGYTGLLNFAHVAFFGLGAYAAALLTKAGVPFLAAFLVAGILAGLFGLFVVFVTRKLKGDYFALSTLGLSFVVYSLMVNWRSLTMGMTGIYGIPKPVILGISFTSVYAYLGLAAVLCALSVFIIYRIVKSPFGRLLEGVRDNELRLRVLGKNTTKIKYKVMFVSAFFAGLAGSLYAHYISFINPSTFYLIDLIFIITALIVGGLASIKGSIAGTIFMMLLPELLRFLPLSPTLVGPVRQLVFSVLLLAVILFRPRGLFGRIDLE